MKHLEGWLHKEDSLTKKWKKKWVVLDGGTLKYYDKPV